MPSSITMITEADADSLWVVRDRIRFLGELAGTALSLVEVEVPPGSGTPPHTHDSPELFRVLSGTVTFGRFDDGPPSFVEAGPGSVVNVPPRVPHNYQNAGSSAALMLVALDRSMVAFFRDLGRSDAPPTGAPSGEEIAAVMSACARHGITVLAGAPA